MAPQESKFLKTSVFEVFTIRPFGGFEKFTEKSLLSL
jgi:hypothetical protein